MNYPFCGTSEFAATILRELTASSQPPTLVVTPPDRRSGRGRKVTPPPVAALARDLGLPLHQTGDINSDGSRQLILATEPDVAAVCAFGQLISEPLLSEVPMLNVHPSLLPRWRGAAPIERAIMAGDARTGVCVIKLTAGLDSGPVGPRKEVAIAAGDDFGTLSERLAGIGARLLSDALERFASGDLALVDQAEDGVTYAEKIEPAERRVETTATAAAEALRVRALTPHIGAFVVLVDGSRLGIRDVVPTPGGPAPGEFAGTESDSAGSLVLGFRRGGLQIDSVQPAGKRWMAAADYLRGYGLPDAPATGPE